MARDLFHDIVREMLEKDGWTITHDPFQIEVLERNYEIDLGAEKILAAEKENNKIAVEVKTFRQASTAYEFHAVLGQYLNYETFLEVQEPDRKLYLAVPKNIFDSFFQEAATQLVIDRFKVKIVVYDVENTSKILWN